VNSTRSLIDRRAALRGGAALALGALACRSSGARGRFDVLLRGANVLDGSGAAPFVADVALNAERIAAIGALGEVQASRVFDARGLCLAPGFVDIHTHSDRTIFEWPGAESRVLQGCTSEITGNCGGSAAPRVADDEDAGTEARWSDVRSYIAAWRQQGAALNHALLVGHGTLRRAVMGSVDRPATADELARMNALLEDALDQGALGLSTGLEYVPGMFTPPEEIVQLARAVARRGKLYASHMRSEEEALLEAVDEALEVGRRTGVRVQVSHLKAAGRAHWKLLDGALSKLERARAEGVDVMADAYPYTAYSTTLTMLLEPWSREGGAEAVLARLRDPATRAKILREVGPHVEREPGGWELVVIASLDKREHQECVGKNLLEIAEMWSVEPAEAFARLLEGSNSGVSFVGHGMQESDVERVLAHPLVMIGSDGRSMAPTGSALNDRPHPRSYGTFPRVLGRYCRERKLFDLATAVRKMTALPAERARLAGRGRIEVGAFADLVLFDAQTIGDTATFSEPQQFPTGIAAVFVNGELAAERGAPTAARAGRFLEA
jgi:N-acyl-D-amino-acid deacylase